MGSKIYKGESMNVGNKIMENSPKLITIEFVKTQDGVGCGMATTGGFLELVKLAGKNDDWLTNQMLIRLEPVCSEMAKLVKELEQDIYKNAFAALQREINSQQN